MPDDLRRQIADAIAFHPANRGGTPEHRDKVAGMLADAIMNVLSPLLTEEHHTCGAEPEPPQDDWDREAAALHAERGYTVAVYFPPAAPWPVVDAALDRIADLVHGLERGGWDGHVVGHMGDVLGVDHDPADHAYLSTGCLHGDQVLPDGRTGHEYCQGETGACGTKTPGVCKHCGAPCRCACHRETTPGETPASTDKEQP